MFPEQLLDPIPIPGVFILLAVLLFGAYEIGFRVGRWWQIKTPEETQGPTDALVGSIIAFLAFLLAITMGMASDRFDARRSRALQRKVLLGEPAEHRAGCDFEQGLAHVKRHIARLSQCR